MKKLKFWPYLIAAIVIVLAWFGMRQPVAEPVPAEVPAPAPILVPTEDERLNIASTQLAEQADLIETLMAEPTDIPPPTPTLVPSPTATYPPIPDEVIPVMANPNQLSIPVRTFTKLNKAGYPIFVKAKDANGDVMKILGGSVFYVWPDCQRGDGGVCFYKIYGPWYAGYYVRPADFMWSTYGGEVLLPTPKPTKCPTGNCP